MRRSLMPPLPSSDNAKHVRNALAPVDTQRRHTLSVSATPVRDGSGDAASASTSTTDLKAKLSSQSVKRRSEASSLEWSLQPDILTFHVSNRQYTPHDCVSRYYPYIIIRSCFPPFSFPFCDRKPPAQQLLNTQHSLRVVVAGRLCDGLINAGIDLGSAVLGRLEHGNLDRVGAA